MQRYSVEVKLFALDERAAGKKWKQIQHDIQETFNVEPPSLRILDKWRKNLNREKLSQLVIDQSKKALTQNEDMVLQTVASGLIPILWQTRDDGHNMECETWLWFFSVIERQLGREKFDQFLEEYRRRRRESREN
ncbi:MAG: hypothetical protein WC562_05305 [Dehalococcoidia bacterium]